MQAKARYFVAAVTTALFIIVLTLIWKEPSANTSIKHTAKSFQPKDFLNEGQQEYIAGRPFQQNYVSNQKFGQCRMETCFNFTRCQFGFKVYIYPPFAIQDKMSNLYQSILSAIKQSKYYTTNSTEACLFVLSLDTLNRDVLDPDFLPDLSTRIDSLSLWNNGQNHIIFNMFSGTWPNYTECDLGFDSGKAILAKSSQSETYFRYGYDISFPLIHKDHSIIGTPPGHLSSNTVPPYRKYTMVFKGKRYVTGIGSESRNALYHLHNKDDIILLTTCQHGKIPRSLYNERCQKDDEEYKKWDYNTLLHNSTFCLVPRGRRLDSFRFLEAIQAACIPVLLSNELVLPFSEVINWNEAVVWADERLLLQVPAIIRSLSYSQVLSLRQQTQFLWQSYFSSIERIVSTTLEILHDRVRSYFSLPVHPVEVWNAPPGALFADPEYSHTLEDFPFYLSNPVAQESRSTSDTKTSIGAAIDITDAPNSVQFTAVVRCLGKHSWISPSSPLHKLLKNLGRSKYLHKVILLWHAKDIDTFPLTFPVPASVTVIVQQIQNVHQHFYPWPDIQTSAVLSLDDGISLNTDEVDFAFHVWQQFPQRIVGYPQATHFWDDIQGKWAFSQKWTNDYSLVLLSAAFYHRYYGHLYWTVVNTEQFANLPTTTGCQAIIMNSLVSHISKQPPLKLTQRKLFDDRLLGNQVGGKYYLHPESQCLHTVAEHFGHIPLLRSEVRIDPLLYQDAVSRTRKKYRQLEHG